VELQNGWTTSRKFKTYHEATDRIRRSLGVRFSDFYNLNNFNVFVEGETDRDYLNFVLAKVAADPERVVDFPVLTSGQVSFLDQGGVKGIEGFLRATYEFIRKERPCFIMLDGDEAGDRWAPRKIPIPGPDWVESRCGDARIGVSAHGRDGRF
jgi:hypothetical protein